MSALVPANIFRASSSSFSWPMPVKRFPTCQRIDAMATSTFQRRSGTSWALSIRFYGCVQQCFLFISFRSTYFTCQEPSNVQQTFSRERTPTVWCIIPCLEFFIKRWESMAGQPTFRDVKDAIVEGIQNLKKWYHKVDNTSATYFICLGASRGCPLSLLMIFLTLFK